MSIMIIENLKEKLDTKKLQKIMEKKGYKFFTVGKFNLNIIGVRLKVDTNEFDDTMIVAYNDNKGKEQLKIYPITTDPGTYWLEHPLNSTGTAILVPDQYRSAYHVGYHRGKYLALCQKGKISVYRDNDKDKEHDMDPINISAGILGINIHHSNPYTESYHVDRWSAGCQVFKSIKDYDKFMKLVQTSKSIYGNSFTYTLLEAKDIK